MQNARVAAHVWLASAVLWLAAPMVSAEMVYRWTTDEGVVSFADEAKRIPNRYRNRAVRVETQRLDQYKRLTETDRVASQEYGERLNARLAELRALNGTADAQVAAQTEARSVVEIPLAGFERRAVRRAADGTYSRRSGLVTPDMVIPALNLTADPNSDEPVVVEHLRVRPDGAITTRTVTVVRQGDRVLSVISPRHVHEHRALSWEKSIE